MKNSDSKIKEKRSKVYDELINISPNIKSGIITQIASSDVKLLFELYDAVFFEGYFKENFKGRLKFSLSTRMTRSAGKTIYPKNLMNMRIEDAQFEIRMGVDFFLRYYETDKDKLVNGIKTKDSLEAFQMVFEHELCHFIEAVEFKETDCRKDRFKTISFNIFGHKSVYHELPTSSEIVSIKYGFKIGDKIFFEFENRKYEGFISNISKRATVMVRNNNGNYEDSKGKRYTKYYVPLEKLRKG